MDDATARHEYLLFAAAVVIVFFVLFRDKMEVALEFFGLKIGLKGESKDKKPPHPLHLLPPAPKGFVGRILDLEQLRAREPEGGVWLAGLYGMGGIGKTALALVLAHEWAPRFADAQLLLDGQGLAESPPSTIALMEQVIRAIHPDFGQLAPGAVAASYRELLAARRVLILLDNASGQAQAEALIPPKGCALIVTARKNFVLGRSSAHRVAELPEPDATALLEQSSATLSSADAAALAKLCGGLPLALELARDHLTMVSGEPNGVAHYLEALRSGPLGSLNADAVDAGKITISEILRLSEGRLSAEEREAWRRLAVFTASFDESAAKAVTGADAEMLRRFVCRSLLERELDRYKMHDLAAEYARGKHSGEELAAAHLTHAMYYAAVGRYADELYLQGGENVLLGLQIYDREQLHLETAFEWLRPRKDVASATALLDLVGSVAHAGQDVRMHPLKRIRWVEAQRDAARLAHNRLVEGVALRSLGVAYSLLGDQRKAIESLEQGLVIARETGDRRGEARALGSLGNAWASLGEAHRAIEFFEQDLAIAREMGDRTSEGSALGNLGIACKDLGEPRRALKFFEQALAIAREFGDRKREGAALNNLGLAYRELGETRKAIEFSEQALAIAREIGDRRSEGDALGNLGTAYVALGEIRKAIGFFEQDLAIAREVGNRGSECTTLGNLGTAHAQLGQSDKALQFFVLNLALASDIGDCRGEGMTLCNLGFAYLNMGEPRKTLECAEQSLAIALEISDRRIEGHALWISAQAFHRLKNRAAAIQHAEASLKIFEAIESPHVPTLRSELAAWRSEASASGGETK